MRVCPRCGDYYADAQLAFCVADGTPLVNVDPRDEKSNEGSRVVAEKAKRLSNRKRKLWMRRIGLGALTTLILALVMARSYTVETTTPVVSPTPSPSPSSSPTVFQFAASPSPTPSPSPSPSASPSPSPSASPTASPSPSPSPTPIVYKISGRVSSGDQNLRDIKISLEGSKLTSTTTDANGYYSFSDLRADGTYTVTPRGAMPFDPPRRTFANLRHDESADFIVKAPVYQISGRVLSLAGPRGGVTVSLEGSKLTSMTTDNNGYYSFGELRAGGDYTVTPRGQLRFAPPHRSFNNLQRDASGDFVISDATPPPPPSPSPSPKLTCTQEDQGRDLNTIRSFEPGLRRRIEGERAKIIAANVPDATVEPDARLERIEFQYSFLQPCRAADVLATYEWLVSYAPIGVARRVNKTVPRQRRFVCGKFLGAWVCR